MGLIIIEFLFTLFNLFVLIYDVSVARYGLALINYIGFVICAVYTFKAIDDYTN